MNMLLLILQELQSSNPRSVCSLLVTATVLVFLVMESSDWRFPSNIFHSNNTQRPFSKDPANQYTDNLLYAIHCICTYIIVHKLFASNISNCNMFCSLI